MSKNIDFGTVADLYDLYVQWDVDIPFFLKACAAVEGEVLELMCGTGRLSLPLLRAGIQMCCLDYSAEMLAILRQKLAQENLTADVQEADVRQLDLGRSFPLILLPFHSIAEILAPEDRSQALARIRQHLQPQGRFLVTLHNPIHQIPKLNGERRQICERPLPERDRVLYVWSRAIYQEERQQGNAWQEYEIRNPLGEILERRELLARFAIIDREIFEKELKDAGFQILNLWGDYATNAFNPDQSPYMIWNLCSKSG